VHLKDRLRYRTRAQRAEKMWLLGKSFRRFEAAAWGVDKIMEVVMATLKNLAEVQGSSGE
jgi:hypothetical protein